MKKCILKKHIDENLAVIPGLTRNPDNYIKISNKYFSSFNWSIISKKIFIL